MKKAAVTPARQARARESSQLCSNGWLIALGVIIAAMAVYLSAPNGPQLVARFAFLVAI